MWKCPVCGKENPALQCEQCHFDGSCHYEAFPTLLPVRAGTAAISRLRQKAGDLLQSPDSGSSKRSLPKWLIPVGAAAVLVLGLTIGLAFGSNRAPLPEESQVQMDSVQEDPVQTDAEQSDTASLPTYFMASGDILQGVSVEDVHTVSFRSTLDGAPSNAWDVSAENNRSILAWMDGSNLIVAANGIISLPQDSSYLFAHLANVTRIDFEDHIDTSNVTNMYCMFGDCETLTTLDLSGFDSSNVMNMAYMFVECNALTTLDLSGFDTANVTNMSHMFDECNALTTLDLSGFDTANVTNMANMFGDCNALTSLNLSGFDTSSVTNMANMFRFCDALTSLNLSGFDTSSVTNMANMFLDCDALTSLDLSGFNTSSVTNMANMFRFCDALTSLDLSGFDTSNVASMSYMFYNCNALTTLDLSGFETFNVTNTAWMFDGCSALTTLICEDEKILEEYQH